MDILKVTKLQGQVIYPEESISFKVTKKDGTAFSPTSSMFVEIRNYKGAKIDTQEYLISADNLYFDIVYTNTSLWERGKEYTMWCRYIDGVENNVVTDISMKVQ